MLQSFSDVTTEQIWKGQAVRRIPTDLQRQALRRLMYLNAAKRLEDLYQPPSNRFHALKGTGRSSISVNMQWRITFAWTEAGPAEVLLKITTDMNRKSRAIAPWHPGEMIKEDFLADYGLTQYALAKALRIPHSRVTDIIKGRRGITADTALRLSRYFGNSAEFWLNLQAEYDLRMADSKRIEAEVAPRAA